MKKISIIVAGLALVAASCTKIETVENGNGNVAGGISFSAYASRLSKAAQEDVTTANLLSFEASAVGNGAVYFDDVTFTKSTVWESSPVYFWPSFALDFYAYNTPGSATGFTPSISADAQTINVVPAAAIADQEDLVAACVKSKTENDNNGKGAIALTFNHYLTQLVVNAKCSNPTYKVLVEGVKLANLAGEGTYTFSTASMEAMAEKINSATSSDYTASFDAKTLGSSACEVMTNAGNGRWYLVPQAVAAWNQASEAKNATNGTYLALKVKITANSDALNIYPTVGGSAWMAVPVPAQLKFEQGKKYNVTFDFFSATGNGAGYVDPETPGELDGDPLTEDNGKKIIGGAIRFDATVDEWEDVNITISL